MTLLPGGEFLMGAEAEMPYEAPVHKVMLKPFWIDQKEVTVADFERFISETKYVTEAENFGWSGVFDEKSSEWTRGDGANWRYPDGGKIPAPPNEPVTQVSWNDAVAYAKWAKKRLPTEAEWEYAARGGLVSKKFAWGDELLPNGNPVANWWQGYFPEKNTAEDGFSKRAPVGSFAPNGYGLYDVTGNVWEWTSDWYDENYYKQSPTENPRGPETGTARTMRGARGCAAKITAQTSVRRRVRTPRLIQA